MSVAEYEEALPDVFASPIAEPSETSANADGHREAKTHEPGHQANSQLPSNGFADIIEFQKLNLDGGFDIEIIPTERFIPNTRKSAHKEKQYDKHALVLRRVIFRPPDDKERARLTRVELEIQSPVLCAWLRDSVSDWYEGTNFQTVPIKLRSPFHDLFFCRDKIRDLAENKSTEPMLRKDAQVLLDFIRHNGMLSNIVKDFTRYLDKGQVLGDILWTIYPPNSLIVLNRGPEFEKECWMVRSVVELVDPTGLRWWQLSGLRLGCDGKAPGLVRQDAILCQVTMDLIDIAHLPLVPVGNYHDWGKLEPVLRARAETVRRVLGKTMCDFKIQTYDGIAWETQMVDFRKPWSALEGPLSRARNKQIHERIIPDVEAFNRHGDGRISEIYDLCGKVREPQTQQNAGKGRHILSSGRAVSPSCGDPNCKVKSCLEKGKHEEDYEIGDQDPHKLLQFQAFDIGSEVKTVEKINYKPEDLDQLAETVEVVFGMAKERLMLLFPAVLPALCLKSKTWRYVCSDGMRDADWSKDAFKSLQLSSTTKQLIKSLVKGHKDSITTGFDDSMSGKNQGLVFLLHGFVLCALPVLECGGIKALFIRWLLVNQLSWITLNTLSIQGGKQLTKSILEHSQAGLGKTLTVESIAEYLQRPLYSISGGELSTEVSSVEDSLDTIFEVAKRWCAVSPLDEADGLLCKRISSEMERNAIVGVFLRKLEYFQGVLFLTTNRKQDLDDAFKSRIHVTVSYPALSTTAQSSIWRNLVEKNSKSGVNTDKFSDEVFETLGTLSLNGSTIKNILRTAVAYACAEVRPLSARHMVAIVETECSEVDDNPTQESLTEAEQQMRSGIKASLETLRRLVGPDAADTQ